MIGLRRAGDHAAVLGCVQGLRYAPPPLRGAPRAPWTRPSRGSRSRWMLFANAVASVPPPLKATTFTYPTVPGSLGVPAPDALQRRFGAEITVPVDSEMSCGHRRAGSGALQICACQSARTGTSLVGVSDRSRLNLIRGRLSASRTPPGRRAKRIDFCLHLSDALELNLQLRGVVGNGVLQFTKGGNDGGEVLTHSFLAQFALRFEPVVDIVTGFFATTVVNFVGSVSDRFVIDMMFWRFVLAKSRALICHFPPLWARSNSEGTTGKRIMRRRAELCNLRRRRQLTLSVRHA